MKVSAPGEEKRRIIAYLVSPREGLRFVGG